LAEGTEGTTKTSVRINCLRTEIRSPESDIHEPGRLTTASRHLLSKFIFPGIKGLHFLPAPLLCEASARRNLTFYSCLGMYISEAALCVGILCALNHIWRSATYAYV